MRAGAIVVGGAAAVLGTFLPWLRSGAVDRSSYEVFDLVERLGFAPDGWFGWMLRLWPLVPLLFVFGAVAQFLSDDLAGIAAVRRVVPLLAAVYAGGVAVGLQFAPEAGLFSFRYGALVTAAGALIVLIAVFTPNRPPTRRARSGRP